MKALIAAAALATLPFAPAMAMQDAEEIYEEEIEGEELASLGTFAGSYLCQDGEHGIFLDLVVMDADDDEAEIAGVLAIVPTLSGKGGSSGMVAGSFNVGGKLLRDGLKLTLEPKGWILEPENYGAARLEGTMSQREDGLRQIVGKPVVPGAPGMCSDLIATEIITGMEEEQAEAVEDAQDALDDAAEALDEAAEAIEEIKE